MPRRDRPPFKHRPHNPVPAKPAPRNPAPAKPAAKRSEAPGRPAQARPTTPPVPKETHWGAVADWYDTLVGDQGSEYHRKVVIPGVLKLLDLDPRPPEPARGRRARATAPPSAPPPRILDVACGQGVLCRALADRGCQVMGVDAALDLINAARQRNEVDRLPVRYAVADASKLEESPDLTELAASFDAATCVLAIANIAVLSPVWRGVRAMLKPGGRLVVVLLHPCFRIPKQSHWGWDPNPPQADAASDTSPSGAGGGRVGGPPGAAKRVLRGETSSAPRHTGGVQYRRIDRYLSSAKTPIQMHPGSDPSLTTVTFHRPLQAYVNTLAESGFLIDRLEEWPSHKRSDRTDPKAPAQDLARREIPMFLALRAVAAATPTQSLTLAV